MIIDLSKIDSNKIYGIKEIEKILGIKQRTLKLYINEHGLLATKLQNNWHVAGENLMKFLRGEGGVNPEKVFPKEDFEIIHTGKAGRPRIIKPVIARRARVNTLEARRGKMVSFENDNTEQLKSKKTETDSKKKGH
ncbi:MAG TPA: hypothetical protein DC049_18600 [Spirochaetia bacterium]|nr:hypothetical protein [Spirochaetia bacterium]